ncbi:hypothetical protein B0J13DRAFT_555239 [Dactylonectria estremocensis]|uniref:Uncharacterized protein n=1 Tax=Dactylonectria estremocensis TaxID=1079267 RepID=A0A9P9J1C1_9HYPO|nr:hypothetical protein B0J13DRAFT_555239 [Dactylonectria estremocensis]
METAPRVAVLISSLDCVFIVSGRCYRTPCLARRDMACMHFWPLHELTRVVCRTTGNGVDGTRHHLEHDTGLRP